MLVVPEFPKNKLPKQEIPQNTHAKYNILNSIVYYSLGTYFLKRCYQNYSMKLEKLKKI